MSTYAVAHIAKTLMGPPIVEYLQRIDATLAPFEGRFRVHGGAVERLEGDWAGDLIVIEFPDRARARGWYASPAYRAIAPLRMDNTEGAVVLIDGVPEGHRAIDLLAEG